MASVQVCPRCGETFNAYPSAKRVFCSRACFSAHGGKHGPKAEPIIVDATRIGYCGTCGKVFQPRQGAPVGYCSLHCRHAARKATALRYYYGQPRPAGADYPERACRNCGNEFKPIKANQVNCSDICKQLGQAKRVRYGKGPVSCATCKTVLVERKPGRPVCDGCRKDPRKSRADHEQRRRLRRYGVTQEWYDATFEAQDRGCAICLTVEPGGKGWAIDHCHASGKARGILCSNCNSALGLLKDNVRAIRRAIEYLERQ